MILLVCALDVVLANLDRVVALCEIRSSIVEKTTLFLFSPQLSAWMYTTIFFAAGRTSYRRRRASHRIAHVISAPPGSVSSA